MPFLDRFDAGRRLAEMLTDLRGEDVVILGLARGGVPVAYEVARALEAPLDVIVVRKLGVPFQPELGMGAIGEGGVRVVNDRVVELAAVGPDQLDVVERHERVELERRAHLFRSGRPPVPLAGRTAVVIDDGIATGSTARAACRVARARGARRVVLAVPVATPDAVADLADEAEVLCLETPRRMRAVGEWYRDFSQTPDGEVTSLLAAAQRAVSPAADPAADPTTGPTTGPTHAPTTARPGNHQPAPEVAHEEVEVTAGPIALAGNLAIPEQPIGLVVFAHGSGSSRHSPRNRFVAGVLNRGGLATLLFDLLTPSEEADRSNVFDIDLLGHRLLDATGWLATRPDVAGLPVGYFGASTGAAAALWAASDQDNRVAAVVSRGGRPDLAGPRLSLVRAPTLLIVGSLDTEVLRLNRHAEARLTCETRMAVVQGAGHLFEEPGMLGEVAHLAGEWLRRHLSPIGARASG